VVLVPDQRAMLGGEAMGPEAVDGELLRNQVREKYREVASSPGATFHFHTGRGLATKLGYPTGSVEELPDQAVESFAGVGNPFALRPLERGERVVDIGAGAGFDSLLTARAVGRFGHVIGVDMTPEMVEKAQSTADLLGLVNIEFREGLAEALPVEDEWADAVIANGVFNLCGNKEAALSEAERVLRPGGFLQFADIANSRPLPPAALRDVDLWTA
jgi:arsenite methyltransferase